MVLGMGQVPCGGMWKERMCEKKVFSEDLALREFCYKVGGGRQREGEIVGRDVGLGRVSHFHLLPFFS